MSTRVVIIGAGFGGLGAARALRAQGVEDITILERAEAVGGVWRDNTYPGAACDVPSRIYSYSFEQDYSWSADFAPQGEILDYLRYCVAKYGLGPHIQFNTELVSASFIQERGAWQLEMANGTNVEAAVLVSAIGIFSRP